MLEPGITAPDFTLAGIDGGKRRLLETLKCGPVLLMFFKVSCSTSQFTFPFIERLFREINPRGGKIWGISQDAADDTVWFANRLGASFPILIDDKPYRVSQLYGLKFVPSLFLIDSDGRIRMSFDGFSKPDILAVRDFFAAHFTLASLPFFRADEKVPLYKPG